LGRRQTRRHSALAPVGHDRRRLPAADYLKETDIVFGIEVEGEARAYPQRILAWHEMFVDPIAGIPLAGGYCTRCGTVILYETTVGGTHHALGTSGFLYRSHKLNYDQASPSLSSTMEDRPAIGPPSGQNIQLRTRSIVTTRWDEWRRRHPETQVPSLETRYTRDYTAGVAYRSYFDTDDLMSATPFTDKRPANKDEILALFFIPPDQTQVAVSARYLIPITAWI
jgi:hypothetical protein